MNLSESFKELNSLKEGLGGENYYYITYVDPEGLSCQAAIKADNSREAEELLYNEYYSSGDDIEIESIDHIDEEEFDGIVADFRGSSGFGKLLKIINESREEIVNQNLNERYSFPEIDNAIYHFRNDLGKEPEVDDIILELEKQGYFDNMPFEEGQKAYHNLAFEISARLNESREEIANG